VLPYESKPRTPKGVILRASEESSMMRARGPAAGFFAGAQNDRKVDFNRIVLA
jgi:hypothetical protein